MFYRYFKKGGGFLECIEVGYGEENQIGIILKGKLYVFSYERLVCILNLLKIIRKVG